MVTTPQGISESVLEWYGQNRRDLPWRRRVTPYGVWISEIMLQQTRVETVIPYYNRFLSRFPGIDALARAPEEEVLALWSGLGYYRRARSLHRAARVIVEEHGGVFPRDMAAALRLPGVGPYTAAAVLSIAHGLPLPVIDGNVERVLARVLALGGDPARAGVRRLLQNAATRILPGDRPADHNQAMMELGAVVCLPRAPRCPVCPLERLCAGRLEGDPTAYPEKAPRRRPIRVHLGVAVLTRDREVFLERRPDGGQSEGAGASPYLRGLWMFPAVEVETPEIAPGALTRHVREGCQIEIADLRHLGSLRHAITFRSMTVHVWVGTTRPTRRSGTGARGGAGSPGGLCRWARREALGEALAVPSLVFKVLELVDG